MNFGPFVFLAAFFGLACSWFGFVLTPQLQLGRMDQTTNVPAGAVYPVARPGLARQGLSVYRANGCAYCHSQQIGQSGTLCDVVLTESGTNQPALFLALRKLRPALSESEDRELMVGLPKTILQGVSKETADAAVKSLSRLSAKAENWIVPTGPDIARGWGIRRSAAEDFLFDYPVQPGSQRVGPDLANAGVRLPDINWHLRHLYAPRIEVKDSTMPPYRFLFDKHRIEHGHSANALNLPPELAPEPGYEIVPKPEAIALATYLASLQANQPLYVAPVTVPETKAPSTNSPAGAAGAATNGATNAPPSK